MSVINTLDSLRFYEYGPILKHLNSEVEIKNIYRILRVLQPLIESLAARGGLLNISIESVGAGTSLIHDNTLPDWFLRSIVGADNITITVSGDGKTITLSSPGGGPHEISDAAAHTDLISTVNAKEEDGSFLAWDNTSGHVRWELCRFKNRLSDLDDDASRNYRMGVYLDYEANVDLFGGSPQSIGGAHRFSVLTAASGSFITLKRTSVTNSVEIAFEKNKFEIKDIFDVSYIAHGGVLDEFDILQVTATGGWQTTSHFLVLSSYAGGTTPAFQRMRTARGTFTTPTKLLSGDIIGEFNFQGRGGSGGNFWTTTARIKATATQDFDATFNGTKLEFQTRVNGVNTPLDTKMSIQSDGSVNVVGALTAASIATTADIDADTMDAAGTARDWDTVQYTRQRPLSFVHFQTSGSSFLAPTWLTGAIGHVLTKVATGTPPAESVIYAGQIPTGFSSTPVLKWRFYNDTVQTGGDQKDVLWRVQYNSPGSSGTISAADTGTPTTTLDTDQAQNTIKEESLSLSNVAAGNLFNVTLSVDSAAGTTLAGDVVLLGVPWIEFVQAGVPDSGSAS